MQQDDDVPAPIEFSATAMDIDFHPSEDIVAGCSVAAEVQCYRYSVEGNSEMFSHSHHTDSVRTVLFSRDGQLLFTGSADNSIVAHSVASNALVGRMANAHATGVCCLKLWDESCVVSGDDDGTIKVWDIRQARCAMEIVEHSDFIADMLLTEEDNTLIVAGGDGHLGVFNMRNGGKLEAMSDAMDTELLSLGLARRGKKLLVGMQDGVVSIWGYGNWGDMEARFPGHPQSIDTMVMIDDKTFFTGSSDGVIRVCQVFPNKFYGVVGEHGDFPIERIAVSHDHRFLGSCSHDSTIKFWDVSDLYEKDENEQEEEEEEQDDNNMDDDDDDDNDDDDDDEGGGGDEDESSEEEERSRKQRKGKADQSSRQKKTTKSFAPRDSKRAFFADL